jgi:hypothetical protein
MPLLREVFDLVKRFHAYGVKLNVETKVEAGAPTETAPMEQFVQVTAAEIRRAHIAHQVTIQKLRLELADEHARGLPATAARGARQHRLPAGRPPGESV